MTDSGGKKFIWEEKKVIITFKVPTCILFSDKTSIVFNFVLSFLNDYKVEN